jgi:hypothetical protein
MLSNRSTPPIKMLFVWVSMVQPRNQNPDISRISFVSLAAIWTFKNLETETSRPVPKMAAYFWVDVCLVLLMKLLHQSPSHRLQGKYMKRSILTPIFKYTILSCYLLVSVSYLPLLCTSSAIIMSPELSAPHSEPNLPTPFSPV